MKRLSLFVLLVLVAAAGCSRDPKALRDKYFASGQKYLDDKRFEEASIEFRNAIRVDKEHVPSYLGIAKAFQGIGDHQNAIGAFQQVIRMDNKNVEARLQIGEYLLAGGARETDLFKQAQQMAEESLQVDPANVKALTLLGNALSAQGEVDKAIEQFEKALSKDPENLKATLDLAVQYRKKDITKAESLFKEALRKHPEAIEARLAIAFFYASENKMQEAEAHLRKAFDMNSADQRSLYALATFYISAKKPAEAENVFKEAIARKPQEREPRWGLAGFYLQQGRIDLSITALNELLKVKPEDTAALLRLAEIYLSQNNPAKAEENVRAVLATRKNDAQAHYLQGKILVRRQEFDKAMSEFENSIKLDESLLPAYLEKASLQFMRNDLDACESTLTAVLQRDKDYLPAHAAYSKLLSVRQRPQDALQQAQEVLAQSPNNEDALVGRANAFSMLGKLQESKRDWMELCQMRPQNPIYLHRLGVVEVLLSDPASALVHFHKALEIQPDLIPAINDILYLYLKNKQYDAAFAELDRLAKTASPQDEIHRFRGQAYLLKGDMDGAEKEFRKVIEVNPQNYQTYILLGQLNMQRNNVAQAIKDVDQLIARNGNLSPAYLMKAFYLEANKDINGAMANYRKSLELDKENPVAANNLAWLLCEKNQNLEEALKLAQAARKKVPNDPDVADTLGWIYFRMKNYTLAVDQLTFSINNRKESKPEQYFRLGAALHAKGDDMLAKQTLRKALELKPVFEGSDEARAILKQIN
jgi:tetratricopeptide (TPR) repeat protein